MPTSIQIVTYYILLFHIFITLSESNEVDFNIPTFIHKNVQYSIIIKKSNSQTKFPVDNFVIAIELLKTLKPRKVLSVADVTTDNYRGDEYFGFSIKDFFIRKDYIEMMIEFRKDADDSWFRIRYSSAKTEIEKEEFFSKNPESNIILERKIVMLLPYTITMNASPELREIDPSDKDSIGNALLPEKSGQLQCHATDGRPNPSPKFIDASELFGANVNNVNNDITQLVWMVRLEDHGKLIRCKAGNEIGNITLRVYHYLTDVLIQPLISGTLSRGSELKCSPKNGYPILPVRWRFVSGPPDAADHYELRDNYSVLFINITAPINSNWSFDCSGSDAMPQVVTKYLSEQSPIYPIKRNVNFTILATETKNPLVQTSNVGIVFLILFLIVVIITATIIAFQYKDQIRKLIQDKRASCRSKDASKSVDQGYTYSEVNKGNRQLNGTDKDDGVCYSEIIATVQHKPQLNPVAPIDNV